MDALTSHHANDGIGLHIIRQSKITTSNFIPELTWRRLWHLTGKTTNAVHGPNNVVAVIIGDLGNYLLS